MGNLQELLYVIADEARELMRDPAGLDPLGSLKFRSWLLRIEKFLRRLERISEMSGSDEDQRLMYEVSSLLINDGRTYRQPWIDDAVKLLERIRDVARIERDRLRDVVAMIRGKR